MSQTKAQLLNPTGVFTLTDQLVGVGATFSGNVSIAGTLTKQDVTNVDSIGVITARNRIDMTQGYQLGWKSGSTERARIHGDSGSNFIIETGSSNTERLRVKDNGNTGIGTNNPTAPLDVYSSTAATNKDLLMVRSTTGAFGVQCSSIAAANPEWRLRTYSSEPIVFSPGNVEKVRITSAGRVGIGTNNPASQLDLSGTNTTVWPFTSDVSNVYAYSPYPHELQIQNHARDVTGAFAGIYFHSGASADGSYVSAARIAAIDSGNYKSDLVFATRNTAFKERLRITADGKVGIGTINPTRGPLHVHENSTGDVQIHLTNQETGTTSSDGFTVFAGGNAGPNAGFVNRESGGTIAFYTHNGSSVGVRLTISQTGNLNSTGTVSDSKGELRTIPRELKGSAYTLVLADAGKAIAISSGGITVPHNVLGTGHAVTIINNSGSDQTITQAASLSLYFTTDGSTGNRTLAGRGMATIWFSSGAEAYISGSGLS